MFRSLYALAPRSLFSLIRLAECWSVMPLCSAGWRFLTYSPAFGKTSELRLFYDSLPSGFYRMLWLICGSWNELGDLPPRFKLLWSRRPCDAMPTALSRTLLPRRGPYYFMLVGDTKEFLFLSATDWVVSIRLSLSFSATLASKAVRFLEFISLFAITNSSNSKAASFSILIWSMSLTSIPMGNLRKKLRTRMSFMLFFLPKRVFCYCELGSWRPRESKRLSGLRRLSIC